MLSEGAAGIIAVAVMKKCAASQHRMAIRSLGGVGRRAKGICAKGGRTPAHPKVEPTEPIRPKAIYPVGVEDLKQYTKYEKIWKEVFKLR